MKNICDWVNCNEIGEYRAPVEKDNSKKYRLLCLDHVKEFNKNWNYFSGMNDRQVIDFLKFYGIIPLKMNLIKINLRVILIICVNLNLIIKI